MLMGVDNCSSKRAVISFCFCVKQKSEQTRDVKGKLEVAAGKFKEWKAEQSEEEKKGDTVISSFSINEKLFEINEKGKYWFLKIEGDKKNLQPTLLRFLDSLYEEAGRLQNGLVAQRIRQFSGGNDAIINKNDKQLLQSLVNSDLLAFKSFKL